MKGQLKFFFFFLPLVGFSNFLPPSDVLYCQDFIDAYITNDTVNCKVVIQDCHFENRINGSKKVFRSDVKISKSTFKEELDFYQSEFKGTVTIGLNTDFKKIDFNRAIFQKDLELKNFTVEAHDKIQFRGVQLNGNLTISNLDLEKALDLSGIYSEEDRKSLKLRDVNVRLLKLDYRYFKLNTDGLNDSEIQNTYEGLLQSQKSYGFIEGYQTVDIDFREYVYGKSILGKTRNLIQWAWWNYGYNPGQPILISFTFLMVFSCLSYFLGLNKLLDSYPVKPIVLGLKAKEKNGRPMVFYWALVYTIILFLGLKISVDNLQLRKPLTYFILFVYFSGLLCVSFILKYVLFS